MGLVVQRRMRDVSQLIFLIVILALVAISYKVQGTVQHADDNDSPLHSVNKRQTCYDGPAFPDCCRQVPALGIWGPFCCRASGRGGC